MCWSANNWLKSAHPFVRRQVEGDIVDEHRQTPEKRIPDGGVTDRFKAMYTHPIEAQEIRRARFLPMMASRGERMGCCLAEVRRTEQRRRTCGRINGCCVGTVGPRPMKASGASSEGQKL